MKKLIRLSRLLLLTSIVVATLQAQIPNPGFEDWIDSEPDGWLTTNFPPLIVNVNPTNNSHSGSWAVRGEVVDFMLPIPPLLSTGSQTSQGFPIGQKFNRVRGYYQLSPVDGDHLFVTAFMGITTPSDTTIIGSGVIFLGDAVSTYTLFSVDINYILPGEPNWATIAITIIDTSGATSGHLGSTMLIDDLEIIKVVSVDDSEGDLIVKEFMLSQNYPNPFNPTTTIKYQVPELNLVTLKVFDVLGSEITTLVNEEKPVGSYEVDFSAIGGSASGGDAYNLPSGIYFYRLKAGDFIETKKMVLLR